VARADTAGGEALETALRALRHRDLSAADLESRLASRGFEEAEQEQALATLRRTGLLDDWRFAESRAASLAARGAGDALVRHDLERAGVSAELVEDALESLEPESERAKHVVARRGRGPRTARYLRGKGFSEETVSAVVASASWDELG
jgi:regulatory protein